MAESEVIPEWFWSLIEAAKPSLVLLGERLEALSRTEIEQWQQAYELAAEAIVPYGDGPDMGGEVGVLSEDGTEDLCKWIVSQGRGLWQQEPRPTRPEVVGSSYWRADQGVVPEYPPWSTTVANPEYRGYQDPSYIAYPIYRARFDAELDGQVRPRSSHDGFVALGAPLRNAADDPAGRCHQRFPPRLPGPFGRSKMRSIGNQHPLD